MRPGLGGFPRAADVPLQPWARALSEYRTSRIDLYPPLVSCKPSGGPSFFNAPGFEIVDAPDLKQIFADSQFDPDKHVLSRPQANLFAVRGRTKREEEQGHRRRPGPEPS